jgi:hypothetical protein
MVLLVAALRGMHVSLPMRMSHGIVGGDNTTLSSSHYGVSLTVRRVSKGMLPASSEAHRLLGFGLGINVDNRTRGRRSRRKPLAVPTTSSARTTDVEVPFWALFILFASPSASVWIRGGLRRRRRHRRGLCLNCGYNLTGLPEPRCPECGQAI